MKQSKNSPPLWGYLIQVAGQLSPPVTFINTMMISGTLAAVSNIPLWLICGGLLLVIAGFGVFAWRFLLPGYWTAHNEQWYRHDNPIRQDIDELKRMVADLERQSTNMPQIDTKVPARRNGTTTRSPR